jgi:hypothetical protein
MAFRQYPVIQTAPQFGPMKFPGGYLWAILFRLPVPATVAGYIIQEVQMEESGTTSGGSHARGGSHYWEAWPVSAGQSEITAASGRQTIAEFVTSQGGRPPPGPIFSTPVNDIFFRTFAAGQAGSRTMRASAGFYDDALPTDFVVGNAATGAGALPSTTTRPSFWQPKGLFRYLYFQFDFTTSRDPANATLQTATLPVGMITSATPDSSLLRTW